MSYGVCFSHLIVWGSLGCLFLLSVWLEHRTSELRSGVFLVGEGRFLWAASVGWALVDVWAVRGAEWTAGGLCITNALLRLGGVVCLASTVGFLLATCGGGSASGKHYWAVEQLGVVMLLHLCWIWLLQSTSVVGALLWLELIGLLLTLLLGFKGVTSEMVEGLRLRNVALEQGLLAGLLILLWVNGLSTILLVGGSGYLQLRQLGIDFELLALSAAESRPFTLVVAESGLGVLFGLGLMLKLLLSPFQTLLLSFYKLLPLAAFLSYLSVYYGSFLVVTLGLIAGGLGGLLAPWLLVFVASLPLVLVSLLGGVEAQTDLRTVFAFSTILNLGLILMGLAVLA